MRQYVLANRPSFSPSDEIIEVEVEDDRKAYEKTGGGNQINQRPGVGLTQGGR